MTKHDQQPKATITFDDPHYHESLLSGVGLPFMVVNRRYIGDEVGGPLNMSLEEFSEITKELVHVHDTLRNAAAKTIDSKA
jgi:hypothetical protein